MTKKNLLFISSGVTSLMFLISGWLAASETFKMVAQIGLWAIVIWLVIVLAGSVVLGLALSWAWSRMKLAIFKRDRLIAAVDAQRAALRLAAEQGVLAAQINQLQGGLAFLKGIDQSGMKFGPLPSSKEAHLPAANTFERPSAAIPERVALEPMLARRKPSLGKLILGVAEGGEVIYGDARQLFHILVAGSTRWGKSIFLQMFLYQLLQLDNIQVYLADLEENTFVDFGLPFAATRAEIESLLKLVWEACQARKGLFTADKSRSYRTLEQYNAHTGARLPYIFCFLDEINGLLDKSSPDYSPETITYLNTLGKRVAKYGVYLVACGQDLRANVMPSGIKNQFISLFQFKAMQRTQARNLIEDSDAHKIRVKGRAYAQINELGTTIELQVPYIEQETIFALREDLDVERIAPYSFSYEEAEADNSEPIPRVFLDETQPDQERPITNDLIDGVININMTPKPAPDPETPLMTLPPRSERPKAKTHPDNINRAISHLLARGPDTFPTIKEVAETLGLTTGGDNYRKIKPILEARQTQ